MTRGQAQGTVPTEEYLPLKAPGGPLPIIMEILRIENGRVAEVWGTGTLRRPDA